MVQVSNPSKPLTFFYDNLSDALTLVLYARAFNNDRQRRLRESRRKEICKALRLGRRDAHKVEVIESKILFAALKEPTILSRQGFTDMRPLLRQAIVAACSAFETYLADRTMEFVAAALRAETLPARLRSLPMSVGQWADIEAGYKRRKWGLRNVIKAHLREQASTAASQVGGVLSTIGVSGWAKRIDKARKVPKGTTVTQLDRITARRNQIAHAADRSGRSRARLEHSEATQMLEQIKEVAEAIDRVLFAHKP